MSKLDDEIHKMRKKSLRRAFLTATAVSVLSTGLALYANYQMRDGGPMDPHAKINDDRVHEFMQKNPDFTEKRARFELIQRADQMERGVANAGKASTLLLFAMGLGLYVTREKEPQNKKDNKGGPRL